MLHPFRLQRALNPGSPLGTFPLDLSLPPARFLQFHDLMPQECKQTWTLSLQIDCIIENEVIPPRTTSLCLGLGMYDFEALKKDLKVELIEIRSC